MSYTKVGENKYRIFISDGTNLNGSRRRYSKTITTDLKGRDLEKFLTLAEYEFEDEVKKKDPKFHELAQGSFKEYSLWWLQYKEIHEKLAPRTLEEYKKMLDNRIVAIIGGKRLDKITNGNMLELMEEIKISPAKSKTGKLSDKSIKHHHTLLKTMFNDAIKLKLLSENPMDSVPVKTPKSKLKDNYYDLKDIQDLLRLLPTQSTKYQLATLLSLSLGLRLGEIVALEWKHIDLQNMKIRIDQSASYTKEKGQFIKPTKTEDTRVLVFPNTLINLFLRLKEDHSILKKIYKWEQDYIFHGENGDMLFIGTISKWFRNFIRKNNLKYITFHGLRHTNATILMAKGTPLVSISKNLGHAKSSTTTDFYAHHLESTDTFIANTFDEIIESGSQSGSQDQKIRLVK